MLSRGPDIETEPYYCLPVSAQSAVPWSQPTSPTPPSRGFTGLLSPTLNASHRLTYPKKNDEGKFKRRFIANVMVLMKNTFPFISAWQSNLSYVRRIFYVWFNNRRTTTSK